MITSTTDTLQGYRIAEYLGVYTEEVVIGTGPFSEFFSKVADTFGVRSSSFEGKLDRGKKQAFKSLAEKAKSLGANAMVGLDIDIMAYEKNRTGMMVTATLVKAVETLEAETQNRLVCVLEKLETQIKYLGGSGAGVDTAASDEDRKEISSFESDSLADSGQDAKQSTTIDYAAESIDSTLAAMESEANLVNGFAAVKHRPDQNNI